jgi:AcrR family transcriptional regulator
MSAELESTTDTSGAARLPLSRERVLRTAIALADSGRIEALTMRKLGQALGVEAMSLYNHVANKDDLLNGIVELVVEEIELPDAGAGWKPAIRASVISAFNVLLRHPWACNLILSPARVCPARLRWIDAVLMRLRTAGFSEQLTCHAYHALDSHIVGFTLWVVNFPAEREDLSELATTFLQEQRLDDYPYLTEHIHFHLTGTRDSEDGEFEFGLDLILDGIERMRDAGPAN